MKSQKEIMTKTKEDINRWEHGCFCNSLYKKASRTNLPFRI